MTDGIYTIHIHIHRDSIRGTWEHLNMYYNVYNLERVRDKLHFLFAVNG